MERTTGGKVMTKEEMLKILIDQAAEDWRNYLVPAPDGKSSTLDLKALVRDGKGYLIKGITLGKGKVIAFEPVSSQRALKSIARLLG